MTRRKRDRVRRAMNLLARIERSQAFKRVDWAIGGVLLAAAYWRRLALRRNRQ